MRYFQLSPVKNLHISTIKYVNQLYSPQKPTSSPSPSSSDACQWIELWIAVYWCSPLPHSQSVVTALRSALLFNRRGGGGGGEGGYFLSCRWRVFFSLDHFLKSPICIVDSLLYWGMALVCVIYYINGLLLLMHECKQLFTAAAGWGGANLKILVLASLISKKRILYVKILICKEANCSSK